MMATFNSKPNRAAKWKPVVAVFLFTATIIFADEAQKKVFAARAGAEFQRARTQLQSDANNSTNAWQFARAAFDFAEFSTNDTQRADLANQGIAACRALVAREPKTAAGHYYLAMNLGQLARTELIGALALVKEMEHEFKMAAELDARLDYAGPERNLGLLYREAPGWPASIGNQPNARSFSEQAVRLAPDYPENHLDLIESYLKWNQPDDAKKEMNALNSLWPVARTNFTGEKWESNWADWSARRDDARKQLDASPAP
jgi:tetratricopeptide (TPR) repeat protein